MKLDRTFRHQQGTALIAALFLIVVVAALGVFAVRLQTDDQQIGTLQLLEYRARAAAHAGLEYASARLANAGAGAQCSDVQTASPIYLGGHPGLSGFSVTVQCDWVDIDAGRVFEIEATGSHGVFGAPDFARRTLTRRVAPAFGLYE